MDLHRENVVPSKKGFTRYLQGPKAINLLAFWLGLSWCEVTYGDQNFVAMIYVCWLRNPISILFIQV